MNSREKRMAIVLSVLLAIAAIAGGYLIVYEPWAAKKEQIAKIKKEIEDKRSKQDQYMLQAARFKGFKALSLPADSATARREYDSLLGDLVKKSGAPAGFTITMKPDQGKDKIPGLPLGEATVGGAPSSKEKPAYQKIVSEIKLVKVDLRMLGEFLRLYHNVQLLHHISAMRIVKKDELGGGVARRTRGDRSDPDQWKDLEVLITTEAVILDGAEDRKTLVSFDPVQAIVGATLYHQLLVKPNAGREFALAQAASRIETTLPISTREYAMLIGRDIFHGPIPKLPEPEKPYVAPPVPKDNIDRFIKLTEITRRGDGTAKFELRDQVNNFTYSGEFSSKGERSIVECNKTWYGPSGKAIRERGKSDLVISDDNKSASNYTFKIVAIDSVEGVIISGGPIGKADGGANGTARPVGGNGGMVGGRPVGGFGTRPSMAKLPTPKPNQALAGSWIATLPAPVENLYYVKHGGSLQQAKKLNAAEVMEIVKRNTAQGMNPFLNADIALPLGEPVAELTAEK